jgi:GNAT superfamily N-acetyltransferase
MEANLVVHMSWLQARLPEARVLDRGDLLVVDSGVATDTFNVVCRARLARRGMAERIAETRAHYERVGRPFSWWVGPLDQPAELGDALSAAGLRPSESEVGMVASLADLGAVDTAPHGLRVERVGRPEGVMDFAAVLAANWSPPDRLVEAYYRAAAGLLLRPDSPLRLYVGYLGTRPVAAAEVCLAGGVAGLYSVCTLEAERRRGFGTALTARPLLDARDEGVPTAILQASAQGQPVYQRLGFRPVGQYVEYKPGA